VPGAGAEGESFVGFEGHGVEHEVKEADGWVAEVLEAGAVQADVAVGPQGLRATSRTDGTVTENTSPPPDKVPSRTAALRLNAR
jgi:hypothetical protein